MLDVIALRKRMKYIVKHYLRRRKLLIFFKRCWAEENRGTRILPTFALGCFLRLPIWRVSRLGIALSDSVQSCSCHRASPGATSSGLCFLDDCQVCLFDRTASIAIGGSERPDAAEPKLIPSVSSGES